MPARIASVRIWGREGWRAGPCASRRPGGQQPQPPNSKSRIRLLTPSSRLDRRWMSPTDTARLLTDGHAKDQCRPTAAKRFTCPSELPALCNSNPQRARPDNLFHTRDFERLSRHPPSILSPGCWAVRTCHATRHSMSQQYVFPKLSPRTRKIRKW